MTYLGKRSVDDQDQSTRNDSNLVKAIVKQDDILKQSIQTDGYEDTSKYFVQSETGRLDFIVGGILHVINVKSLYLTLPASRIGKLLRASSLPEVLSFCDKYQTEGEGRPHPIIMFDRWEVEWGLIVMTTWKYHFLSGTGPASTPSSTSTGLGCSTCVTAPAPPSGQNQKTQTGPHLLSLSEKKIWTFGTLTSSSWSPVVLSSISRTLRCSDEREREIVISPHPTSL